MEFEQENKKIGAGIITLSVLHFITSALTILGGIILLGVSVNDDLQKELTSLNVDLSTLNTGNIVFQCIILRIILVVSLILILNKNKIGIYGYYLFVIASIISKIVFNGFNISSIIMSLIFPILMGIFISKKKDLFGF